MKRENLVTLMTLEEKAAILAGKGEWISRNFDRLGIPSMFMSDGPSGIRKQSGAGDHLGLNPSVPATCYPSSATIANSWDRDLAHRIGEGLGTEAMEEEVNVLLGPGMNIKRNPLCGRNFEYFSEDPYLAGELAAAEVQGVQSKGASACIKHFAVNSQETRRMAMDSVLDERTLREIYLTAFEIAVKKAHPLSLMTSYNEVNGVYANENYHLLQEILRDDWGFEGFVVSDWGGSNDHVLGVKNGSNLEMPAPGLDSARQLVEAVKNGSLTEDELNERVDELLDIVMTLAENQAKFKAENPNPDKEAVLKANHALARRAAADCFVLLKNDDSLLPLADGTKVAVIGDFAFVPRYQGAGSSQVNSFKVDTVADLIDETGLEVVGKVAGYQRNGSGDEALKKEALDLAKQADVVLYCFGLNEQSESEGLDRTHLRIPQNQVELLEALCEVNPNIVGIISAGSVIEMPWRVSTKALLNTGLSGSAGAGAVLDVITGKVNPSGKTSETYINAYEETPSYNNYPAKERTSEHREGLYVGYRYFDKNDLPVTYPFGYGLSYTTFEYSNLEVSEGGVKFDLKNTGDRAGAEVCQMYVSLPEAQVFRAKKELKGFEKVYLEAGETKKVEIPFDEYTFRYWNVKTNGWEVEGGRYEIAVGGCSADLPLKGSLEVAGTGAENPYSKEELPSYYSGDIMNVDAAEFEKLLGHEIPDGSWSGEIGKNDALCQLYYSKGAVGRFVYNFLHKKMVKAEEAGEPDLNTLFQYNMPLRACAKMTGGMVDMNMVDGLVKMVNGHFWSGLGHTISGFFKNSKANKKYEQELESLK